MEKKFSQLGDLKVGSYVLIEGIPCKVLTKQKSKPGKHGSAKIRIEAQGIVDGRRRSIVNSTDARVEVPIIMKLTAQVISIDGKMASVMDTGSYETFDIEIPEEWEEKVIEGSNIIYWDVGVKLMKGLK